ncbi:MAG: fused MFS/spermidine synthase [Acidobacterium ailaaui]|nr:fused MFS/spermidine synthase [Pseudacidobacterium ailaaui]MCL6464194.1 fused MFS/spermidine synthase [Pseudacidobacterium ailaaui]
MALLTFLYAVAVFLSAFLLFVVQPMAARQLLPVLGGSAAVWTTCLVFFQTVLLLGYLYADQVATRLAPKRQAMVHVVVLASALAGLGIRIHPSPWAATWHPFLTIFVLLALIVGVPYFALSATTPLLQAWHVLSFRSEMPYRMFAYSNAGALLALVLYPVLIEPYLSLHLQTRCWSAGFFLFAVLCGGIAWSVRHTLPVRATGPMDKECIPLRRKLLWVFLPCCSSLLLCAFTSQLSQNIAAIPLLWIPPLAMYLLTFILAFHSPRAYPRWLMLRLTACTLGVLGYVAYGTKTTWPVQVLVPLYCISLFVICFFLHGELYRMRPSAETATRFYLALSLGSAIGAMFAGVAAPVFFRANYELVVGLVLTSALALVVTWNFGLGARLFWTAAVLALVWVGAVQARVWQQDTIAQLRSFYGILRVTQTHWPPRAEITRTLYHGTIQHGTQMFGNGLRMQPASYYAPDSGVGLALRFCCSGRPKRVGVVGLGTGTLAVYGQPEDSFRFYEIDPLVERLARELFTYLRETPARVDVVPGDARYSLNVDRGAPFDVLVLDAFSGDAVPVHLLTTQALSLYQKHLTPDGILAFHISSQYLNLEPVLAREAQQARLHAVTVFSSAEESSGIFAAEWVLLTRNERFLAQPEVARASRPAQIQTNVRLWTDDYASVLPILKWGPHTH